MLVIRIRARARAALGFVLCLRGGQRNFRASRTETAKVFRRSSRKCYATYWRVRLFGILEPVKKRRHNLFDSPSISHHLPIFI